MKLEDINLRLETNNRHRMQRIYIAQTFRSPLYFKSMCYVMSAIMLGMAAFSIVNINESLVLIFTTFVSILLAWSMFAYTRLHLVVSNDSLVFKGGAKPHEIDWKTIYKVDMAEVRKYSNPLITVY